MFARRDADPDSASAAEERLRRFEAVTDAALAHLSVEDLQGELLDRVRDLLGVDTATVLLLDESGRSLVATAARGIEEEVRQGVQIPVGDGFAGRIAVERRPVIIEQVNESNVVNPILYRKGIHSLLGVPLLFQGVVTGVLHVGTMTQRLFTDDDVEMLQVVADRLAVATQARTSEIDRAAAKAVLRSLVPSVLPGVAGLEIAVRYVPGEGLVGGDWYDVFRLPTGELGVVVGDVTGKGLHAAIVMGRIRSTLRAYALESTDPADVLTRVNRKLEHFEPDAIATVLYAVVDVSRDRLHVSSAGHLPPIRVTPGSTAQVVEIDVDPPIGLHLPAHRRSRTIALPTGSSLVLYTDGLVERRTRPIDDGLQCLVDVLGAGGSPAVLCATAMGALVGAEAVDDDITLVAIRRVE